MHIATLKYNAPALLLQFSTTFNMEYRFEEVQNLQFVVYDVDDKHHVDDIDKQQLLGAMECTLAEIMAAGEHLTKPLGLKGGYIFCLHAYLIVCASPAFVCMI